MTPEEAKKVISIMAEADSGCPTCVKNLFEDFNKVFPGFEDLLQHEWEKDHAGKWENYI